MKHIETYRKIAIMLNQTNYEIPLYDICRYINTEIDFACDKDPDYKTSWGYMEHHSGLSKEIIHRLDEAETEIWNLAFGFSGEYPLEKEFMIMANAITMMQECEGFIEQNDEFFNNAQAYLNSLATKIIEKCENEFTDEYQDLMTDNKIRADRLDEALRRYMNKGGYRINAAC